MLVRRGSLHDPQGGPEVSSRRLGGGVPPVSRLGSVGKMSDEPSDPDRVAAAKAESDARHAHHEAGHAVAVIVRGGTLKDVFLGTADWSTDDTSADTPGGTRHRTAWEAQPFVTFAGPWAEAMWTVEHDDDIDDLYEALDYAWQENSDGDTAKYGARVSLLSAAAAELGFATIGRDWEVEWAAELEPLWHIVCQVAALLIDNQPVTHDVVQSLLADAD